MKLLLVEDNQFVRDVFAYEFDEIATILAISANTAASRYRYALQKLRAAMQPEGSQ